MNSRIVIGSRGSRLALVQAEWVKAQLYLLEPEIDVQIEIIKTTGDVNSDPLSVIGGKGVFTKELESALMESRIDVAVHSLKDLPTIVPESLKLAAICEREDPRDALILPLERNGGVSSLNDLRANAVVGTSSPRRLAQLAHIRPDIQCADLRGNVDTRLRKLDEGQYDVLILAAAGLRRLGFESRISVALSPDQMLPAVGQGALGIQTRDGDAELNQLLTGLDHEDTSLACIAERSLLRALGGGCLLPIAGHAVGSSSTLTLNGLVASRDGKQILRDEITGDSHDAEELGAELAARLLASGAGDLL
jgi:hydroxymethylbilane synthase